MSTEPMIPMFSPDGKPGDVPQSNLRVAIDKGFTRGVNMWTKEGKPGMVPLANVKDALSRGFLASKPAPQEDAKAAALPPTSVRGQFDEFKNSLGENVKGLPGTLAGMPRQLLTPHDTFGATREQEVKMGPIGRLLYNTPADLTNFLSQVATSVEQGHLGKAGADLLTAKATEQVAKHGLKQAGKLVPSADAAAGVVRDYATSVTKKYAGVIRDFETMIDKPGLVSRNINRMMSIGEGVENGKQQLEKYGRALEVIANRGTMANTYLPAKATAALYKRMRIILKHSAELKRMTELRGGAGGAKSGLWDIDGNSRPRTLNPNDLWKIKQDVGDVGYSEETGGRKDGAIAKASREVGGLIDKFLSAKLEQWEEESHNYSSWKEATGNLMERRKELEAGINKQAIPGIIQRHPTASGAAAGFGALEALHSLGLKGLGGYLAAGYALFKAREFWNSPKFQTLRISVANKLVDKIAAAPDFGGPTGWGPGGMPPDRQLPFRGGPAGGGPAGGGSPQDAYYTRALDESIREAAREKGWGTVKTDTAINELMEQAKREAETTKSSNTTKSETPKSETKQMPNMADTTRQAAVADLEKQRHTVKLQVNGEMKEAVLSPEKLQEWEQAKAHYEKIRDLIKKDYASDPQYMQRALKGKAMEWAAEKRRITDLLTDKERAAQKK